MRSVPEVTSVLADRIVLITGAGQGLGRAAALEAARAGAAALALVDRNRETAAQTAAEVAGLGADAIVVPCDLRRGEDVVGAVAATVERFGGLDVVMNVAGVIETLLTERCAVDELPDDVWDAVHDVNVKAVWRMTKAAAPHLRASPRAPAIVNVASVSGLIGFAAAPAYCSSKGAVVQLTRATAADLAPDIRCNCVCPGLFDTPMARRHIDAAEDPASRRAEMTVQQLVPRLGDPAEVGQLMVYLASEQAAFINGADVTIDGGALAWHGVRGA